MPDTLTSIRNILFLLQNDDQADLHPTNTVRNIVWAVRDFAMSIRRGVSQ